MNSGEPENPAHHGSSLAEPLPLGREFADAAQARVESEKLVARPRERIEAPELARSVTLPAKRAPMRPVETEHPHLAVVFVGDEHGRIGTEGHRADPAEFVGGGLVGERRRPDGDDRHEPPLGRGSGVGDVDHAADGVDRGCKVAGARRPLVASGRERDYRDQQRTWRKECGSRHGSPNSPRQPADDHRLDIQVAAPNKGDQTVRTEGGGQVCCI